MDPLSATAGIVNVLDTVATLSKAVAKFRHDYALAEEDLNAARSHALLLEAEIKGLELNREQGSQNPAQSETPSGKVNVNHQAELDNASFAKALVAARDLLRDIEDAFPLRSEPHTWSSKVRWAIKDKKFLDQLKIRLQSTESTLQGIVSMEQLRVSRLIYSMLQKQQHIIERMDKGEIVNSNTVNMAMVNQYNLHLTPTFVSSQSSESNAVPGRYGQVSVPGPKYSPWIARFDYWGLSAFLVSLNGKTKAKYQGSVQLSLLDKLLRIQMEISLPKFSFTGLMQTNNTISADSEMAIACKKGNFHRVRDLLANGMAHGSDTTPSGWPMLDYAIESGSTRLVSLLLEHGARSNTSYGEHNMSALQASFLRGKLDIARVLLSKGADIEHVDNGGYSVLSYLWVVDSKQQKSLDFMALCQTYDLCEVNACDDRGWNAFHRAAAIGSSHDIEAFLRIGASLDMRATWYGWTPLFFAASHDNVDTFQTIVRHTGCAAYQSLDGDGWTLLHCCVYFGAPNIMRLVLQNGVDVNQKSFPTPLPEDPGLSYRELTAADIAVYIGPNRCQMFMNALCEVNKGTDVENEEEVFWDTAELLAEPGKESQDAEAPNLGSKQVYGAEDVDDDRWTLLHWACYNGSPKVRDLLLLRGVDPEHEDAIKLEENPTLLPTIPSVMAEA